MKFVYLFILIFSVLNATGQKTTSFDYCYSHNDAIYAYSLSARKATMVNKGTDPYISPDGTKLAYTVNASNGGRHVEVIDLATKQKTILHTNNNNCYGPVWSPDGRWIAYNAFINSTWFICLIDKDNHPPIVLTKTLKSGTGSFSPTWTADSKSILAQDMETIFIFSTNGSLVEKISIKTFADVTDISSESKFLLTNDESKIVYDCSVNEQGFEGPPGAIFVFDKKTKTSKRVSPKGYWFSQPFLKGDRIYFSGSKKDSKTTNVYSVGFDGSGFKLELSNCSDFTSKIN